jgi:hypothetical protein
VAWHTALLRPDVVRRVAALSVPHNRRGPVPTLTAPRKRFGETYYQLYFQRAGVEAEFEADLDRTFRRILYGISGDNPNIRELLVSTRSTARRERTAPLTPPTSARPGSVPSAIHLLCEQPLWMHSVYRANKRRVNAVPDHAANV